MNRNLKLVLFLISFVILAFLIFNFNILINSDNLVVLGILYFNFGYVYADLWERISCDFLDLDGKQHIGGIHYHHSLLGAPAIIAGIIFLALGNMPNAIISIAFGIGTIVQHTLSEKKFVFVTRD